MNQKIIVSAGILGVLFWLFLGVFSFIPWQVAGVLAAASVGISTLLLHYERGKSTISINHTKLEKKQRETEIRQPPPPKTEGEIKSDVTAAPSKEEKTKKTLLLPDKPDITKLDISNYLFDQIYEQARAQALVSYPDAQLAHLTIQIFPFHEVGRRVNIYLDFYSKWANKRCKFRFSEDEQQVIHAPPDRPVREDSHKNIFETMPWRKNPQWIQFLNRVYAKIGPFASATGTIYHLSANPPEGNYWDWSLSFDDCFAGREYRFGWNGKDVEDDQNIKQFA